MTSQTKHWLGKKRPDLSEKFTGSGNPMYGRKLSEETKAKMRRAHAKRLKGYDYTNPKDGRTQYVDVHKWMYRYFGSPMECQECHKVKKSNRSIHWANISGSYLRVRDDWVRLCASCHKQYDLGKLELSNV